jgi:holo-[acyl-carrier protein] synthase
VALDGRRSRDDPGRMALRIGMDLVDVRDVEESLARFGSRYLERVFTPAEIAASRGGSNASCLAVCFAAKEATLKALPARGDGLGWTNIEVEIGPSQRTSLTLHGAAAKAAERAGITALDVSVTRAGTYAAAIVLTEGSADRHAASESCPC